MTFNEELFLLGAKLPLQPYFTVLFHGFEIPPYQLNLNGKRTNFRLYVIQAMAEQTPATIKEIKYLILFKKGPKQHFEFYYLRARTKDDRLVMGNHFCNKKLKDIWFYVDGDWCQSSLSEMNIHSPIPYAFKLIIRKHF